ncbi:hypothetical protein [Pseudonocardia sp. DLS-67]
MAVPDKPDFYWTDDQGRRRPGYKAKGKGGGLLLAIVLTVAVGAGGTATIAGTATAGASGTTVSASTARTSSQARRRDANSAQLRLLRQALRVEQRFDSTDDCVAHSYGQVREFFREQPCVALHRAWFDVRDGRRGLVLVAVSWVEMPDTRSARELHELVDTYGTGNVTELSREEGPHRRVRFTGKHYVSRRDGPTVMNAQAEPIGRAGVAAELERIAASALG